MLGKSALRGLAQVNVWAADVKAARDWYARFLGVEPYFQRPDASKPAYVEFRLGDSAQELGIIYRNYQPDGALDAPGRAIVRWHVDGLSATLDRLLELRAHEEVMCTPELLGNEEA